MISSSDFRQTNKVLFSAPILAKTKVEEDFSAGWGASCSTGEVDVIDLNGNGQADQPKKSKNRGSRDESKVVSIEEPALHAPSLEALSSLAQRKGTEVLTPSDLPGGIFICNPKAEQIGDEVVQSHESIRSLDSLVAERFDPAHPEARWAIDVANQQFLIFVPVA